MKHDCVMTVAIGRNYGKKNQSLTPARWRNFKMKAKSLVSGHAQIVAATHGRGINSDDVRNGMPEQTFVIVAINPKRPAQLRKNFAKLLKTYNQTSSAFALDRKHFPVFS